MSTLQSYAEASPERFTLRLFVDKPGTAGTEDVGNLTVRRVGEDDLRRCLQEIASRPPAADHAEQGKRILFLVCGPEPMVTAIAGLKPSDFSQGPVGGILGKLGLQSSNVWKL